MKAWERWVVFMGNGQRLNTLAAGVADDKCGGKGGKTSKEGKGGGFGNGGGRGDSASDADVIKDEGLGGVLCLDVNVEGDGCGDVFVLGATEGVGVVGESACVPFFQAGGGGACQEGFVCGGAFNAGEDKEGAGCGVVADACAQGDLREGDLLAGLGGDGEGEIGVLGDGGGSGGGCIAVSYGGCCSEAEWIGAVDVAKGDFVGRKVGDGDGGALFRGREDGGGGGASHVEFGKCDGLAEGLGGGSKGQCAGKED